VLRNGLIVFDDGGFASLGNTGSQLLFQVISAAYERRSLTLASHWASNPARFLPEHTTAASLGRSALAPRFRRGYQR
jgi:hypothetical protein